MRIVTVNQRDRAPVAKYSDINHRVGIAGKGTVLYDLDSIRQNILLIIGTSIKTKWFKPEIGNYLDNFLFDPVDDLNANRIRDEIFRILDGTLEDRIVVTKVDVIPDEAHGNYFCEAFYNVPTLNSHPVQDSTTFGLAA